jgi:hypothetical protein
MTSMATRYELRAPAVICDDLDGEVIAIDLEVGRYYRITGPSSHVWSWLIAGSSPDEIVATCSSDARAAVDAFTGCLLECDLIREAPLSTPSNPPTPWDLTTLDVEVFSDLEDILGLDPIHEVDPERGWPYPIAE